MTKNRRRAKLPGLARNVTTGNPAVDRWIGAVTERMEVREGARGDKAERAVTVRELDEAKTQVAYITNEAPSDNNLVIQLPGGGTATVAVDKFVDSIKDLQLFRDMVKSLNDPSRFDHIPGEIRDILLQDIALEARRRGAAITRMETITDERFKSLSVVVETLTAAVADAASGVRDVTYAYATENTAMAGRVTQLVASLGKYYQDGSEGRAVLEDDMFVYADRIDGLRAQRTIKVEAGKAIAGIGLASTEDTAGNATSAVIISANKFAIVDPNTYTGGLTNTPDVAHVPFGVDGNGIYMNAGVYIRGTMRVDTGGKTLIQGLRGSVSLYRTGTYTASAARNAVWTHLGNAGTPTNNNHLVIGDTVTFTNSQETVTTIRAWNGSSWSDPGVRIDGDVLIDGSLAAHKIDTRGLTIKDNNGNVILGAGVGLNVTHVEGLGNLALADQVNIGWSTEYSNVAIDGQLIRRQDLVSTLHKIDAINIGTFMNSAAIGTAYIGNAQVQTLNIAGENVTVPRQAYNPNVVDGEGLHNWKNAASASVTLPYGGRVMITTTGQIHYGSGWRTAGSRLVVNGLAVSMHTINEAYTVAAHAYSIVVGPGQTITADLDFHGDGGSRIQHAAIILLGVQR